LSVTPDAVPVYGKNRSVAEGKWLSYKGKLRQTFIDQQLLQCSHALPFSALHYKAHSEVSAANFDAQLTPQISELMARDKSIHRQTCLEPACCLPFNVCVLKDASRYSVPLNIQAFLQKRQNVL